MDQRLLILGQHAHAARGCGDELQLFRRVNGRPIGNGNIEPAQHHGCRALQEPHRRPGQFHEHQHGRRYGYGQRIRPAQGKRFGYQLADHHVEIGNDSEAERDSQQRRGVRQHSRIGQRAQPAEEEACGEGFADPAQGQRTERDAELHGGQKVVQLALQAAHGAGSRHACGHHLLNARVAD